MNIESPLNRVLGHGTARDGSTHWWRQRLTAVALIPLGLWLCVGLGSLDDFAYESVSVWMGDPLTSIMLVLTAIALSHHSYLGIQVIIEDYIHARAVKVGALALSVFAHAGLVTASVFAILKIALAS